MESHLVPQRLLSECEFFDLAGEERLPGPRLHHWLLPLLLVGQVALRQLRGLEGIYGLVEGAGLGVVEGVS